MSALTSAVYNYHIGIITSGDFLTNDQTGAPLAGNPYANMETLLGLNRVGGGNSGDVTVTANDVNNPIMKSYTAGQVIQTYSGVGYNDYEAVGNDAKRRSGQPERRPVSAQRTRCHRDHGRRHHQRAFRHPGSAGRQQSAVERHPERGARHHAGCRAAHVPHGGHRGRAHGHGPGADSRGCVAGRAGGPGIYDQLIPILTAVEAQYDFVGSYYVDIGDNPNPTDPNVDPTTTDWTKSLPYYKPIQALGGEIGTHSYHPSDQSAHHDVHGAIVGGTPAGSTTITLDHVPSFYGITVGMWLSGTGIGSNTLRPAARLFILRSPRCPATPSPSATIPTELVRLEMWERPALYPTARR